MKASGFSARTWLKRILVGITAVLFGLAAIGIIYQSAASQADRQMFALPGSLIDVGGFKMHLYCIGAGSPTIILESLAGGYSPYWGWIQPELAKTTRVCAYDRAGRGWSEADPEPISLARTVRNLHTLLVQAQVEGPYVMVGHSIGGVYVRRFAAEYPDEVAGLVLVDSAHPGQFQRQPELLKENDKMVLISAANPVLARLGLFHLYFAGGGEIDFAGLVEPQKAQIKAGWSSPEYFMSQRAEMMAAPGIYADALSLGGLDALPLAVVSAEQGLRPGWAELQAELAALSTNRLHRIVTGSTHASLVFNQQHAQAVSEAIGQILTAVRTGRPLER